MDEDNNCFSLPDIPIADIDDVLAAAEAGNLLYSSGNEFYIFPFPTLNCSGTVSRFRFCYSDNVNDIGYEMEQSVFTLLLLQQQIDQMNYIVTRAISVLSTPRAAECRTLATQSYCCDTYQASFDIPASGFAYGIVGGRGFLFYSDLFVMHYRSSTPSSTPEIGTVHNIGNNIQTDRRLRLIQFTIGKCSYIFFQTQYMDVTPHPPPPPPPPPPSLPTSTHSHTRTVLTYHIPTFLGSHYRELYLFSRWSCNVNYYGNNST